MNESKKKKINIVMGVCVFISTMSLISIVFVVGYYVGKYKGITEYTEYEDYDIMVEHEHFTDTTDYNYCPVCGFKLER